MSTPPPSATPAQKPDENDAEIKIVSHSNLFYWWPVWAVGFLMGLLTLFDGGHLAVVPSGTIASRVVQVETAAGPPVKFEAREALVVPPGKAHLPPSKEVNGQLPDPEQPHLDMATSGTFGVIFLSWLLLVITITNVPLRGMWSVVVIVTLILGIIILCLAPWGDGRSVMGVLIEKLSLLDIRINLAGYIFVSGLLFAIWLVTFLFFDQQTYIVFTPGQLKVRTEIGGGEKAYDTSGMTVEKQRSDLFRHWILGLGSGDLVVNTTGAGVHHFDLPNVLFIGRKVQQIEDMLREKAVVRGNR